MFNLQKEIDDIEKLVVSFEKRLTTEINNSITKSLKNNPDISIIIRDNHVVLSDYVDGEQVDYLIYYASHDAPTTIEITKQGASLGYLDADTEMYTKYVSIVKPLEDAYLTYFEWDGFDFLKRFK